MRYYFDSQGATFAIGLLFLGFLLMFTPLILSGALLKILIGAVLVIVCLAAFWFALARGTYVTIDRSKGLVYGTVFFFKAKVIPIADIVSITSRKGLLGALTDIYLSYRKADGTLTSRTIITKEALKRGEFTRFLDALASANPRIDIPKELRVG